MDSETEGPRFTPPPSATFKICATNRLSLSRLTMTFGTLDQLALANLWPSHRPGGIVEVNEAGIV